MILNTFCRLRTVVSHQHYRDAKRHGLNPPKAITDVESAGRSGNLRQEECCVIDRIASPEIALDNSLDYCHPWTTVDRFIV